MKLRALYRNVAGFLEDFCATLAHLLIPTSLVLPIPTSCVALPRVFFCKSAQTSAGDVLSTAGPGALLVELVTVYWGMAHT